VPIIKSAKKRVRITRINSARNVKTKQNLKKSLKIIKSADGVSKAQSNIDKALKKGLIHKNKAARLKKRLAAQAKAAGVKTAKTAKKAAKPVAKKPAAAKKPAKKTAKKPAKK
jgi:small subunit ribosomal protein S20